jgi:hypothetical protein
MAGRFIPPSEQYLTDSGDILSGGKLFFYDSGTAVLKNTFSDPDGVTANTNPVILDGAGRTPNIFLDGAYKLIIKDADDVQIEERDPVLASDSTTKGFGVWNAVTTYSLNDIVRASNNLLYKSIANSNQNNEPSATAAKWTQVQLLESYNANQTYVIGNIIIDSIGNVYRSLTNGNVGNTPSSSPTDWTSIVAGAFAGNVTVGGTLGVTGATTLAGGAYLGGTAAANLLDDYEEGVHTTTMTPATSGSVTLSGTRDTVAYVKVGQIVHIHGNLVINSVSSPVGALVNVSLPFPIGDLTDSAEGFGNSATVFDNSAAARIVVPLDGNTGSTFRISLDASTLTASDQFYISFSYSTNA